MIEEFRGKYEWLSNFYPCEIEYEGIVYPTTEHFYVAMKTTDPHIRKHVSTIETPGKAKRYGHKEIDIREDWDDIKIQVMEYALNKKFNKPHFKELLIETEYEMIVEGNRWHDNFYGSCICDKCGNNGKNILGKLLMTIRKKL
jgi:ribA/ribD-fused uncharacterized protein